MEFSQRGNNLIGQKMFTLLDKANEYERLGKDVIHMELGDPSLYPPGRVVNGAIISLLNSEVGYASPSGLIELRDGLAEEVSVEYGRKVTSKNVVIGTANLFIYQIIDLICNPSDSVVIFSPYFPTYKASLDYTGVPHKVIELEKKNGFHISKEDIDNAIDQNPKLIILNSGNNPSGAIYDSEVIEYLVEEAYDHEIWVLSDETYGMLSHRGKYTSCGKYRLDNLIVLSSFSKTFNIPGFRLGYCISNEKVIEKLSLSNSTLISCLPLHTQKGVQSGLSIHREFAEKQAKYYRELLEELTNKINDTNVICCEMPDSAFYIFIDISQTGMDSDEFSDALFEEEYVVITPGSSFGVDDFVRVSVAGKREDVVVGVDRVCKFSIKYAKKRTA